MNLFAYIGLNLGVVSLLAITPIQKPVVDDKTYESHLFMQMWGSFDEQETELQMVSESPEGTANVDSEISNTEAIQQTPPETVVESVGTDLESSEHEVVNEQTTSEEELEGCAVNVTETVEVIQTANTESPTEAVPNSQAETAVVESAIPMVESVLPLYTVEGQMLDPAIQEYLYTQLCNNGIGWFFPYALCIAYQESSFDIYAVNLSNGIDKGLFQFRSTYWGEGDIFNPYTQIDVFTRLMVNRANMGCTVSDMISRHNQSDYGSYNQAYVDAVMSHSGTLTKVR